MYNSQCNGWVLLVVVTKCNFIMKAIRYTHEWINGF